MRAAQKGEPAKARLKDAKTEVGVPIHGARTEESHYGPHRRPGVRRRAADERVIPKIRYRDNPR